MFNLGAWSEWVSKIWRKGADYRDERPPPSRPMSVLRVRVDCVCRVDPMTGAEEEETMPPPPRHADHEHYEPSRKYRYAWFSLYESGKFCSTFAWSSCQNHVRRIFFLIWARCVEIAIDCHNKPSHVLTLMSPDKVRESRQKCARKMGSNPFFFVAWAWTVKNGRNFQSPIWKSESLADAMASRSKNCSESFGRYSPLYVPSHLNKKGKANPETSFDQSRRDFWFSNNENRRQSAKRTVVKTQVLPRNENEFIFSLSQFRGLSNFVHFFVKDKWSQNNCKISVLERKEFHTPPNQLSQTKGGTTGQNQVQSFSNSFFLGQSDKWARHTCFRIIRIPLQPCLSFCTHTCWCTIREAWERKVDLYIANNTLSANQCFWKSLNWPNSNRTILAQEPERRKTRQDLSASCQIFLVAHKNEFFSVLILTLSASWDSEPPKHFVQSFAQNLIVSTCTNFACSFRTPDRPCSNCERILQHCISSELPLYLFCFLPTTKFGKIQPCTNRRVVIFIRHSAFCRTEFEFTRARDWDQLIVCKKPCWNFCLGSVCLTFKWNWTRICWNCTGTWHEVDLSLMLCNKYALKDSPGETFSLPDSAVIFDCLDVSHHQV